MLHYLTFVVENRYIHLVRLTVQNLRLISQLCAALPCQPNIWSLIGTNQSINVISSEKLLTFFYCRSLRLVLIECNINASPIRRCYVTSAGTKVKCKNTVFCPHRWIVMYAYTCYFFIHKDGK